MKIHAKVFLAMLFCHQLVFAADEQITATRFKKLPEYAMKWIEPQVKKGGRIVIESSARWIYEEQEHFFISLQYGKDSECFFFDINMQSQYVRDLDSYAQCEILGPIKIVDLNEDGYFDFFVPIKRRIILPAPMWMKFNAGFVFNKNKGRHCISNDAGYAMQDFDDTKQKPKSEQFNDLRC